MRKLCELEQILLTTTVCLSLKFGEKYQSAAQQGLCLAVEGEPRLESMMWRYRRLPNPYSELLILVTTPAVELELLSCHRQAVTL